MTCLVVLFGGFLNVYSVQAHFPLLISVSTDGSFVIVHRSSLRLYPARSVYGDEPSEALVCRTFEVFLARLWSFSILQIHIADRRTDLALELNIRNFISPDTILDGHVLLKLLKGKIAYLILYITNLIPAHTHQLQKTWFS